MAQWAAFFVARHSECRTLIDTDLNRKPVGLRWDSRVHVLFCEWPLLVKWEIL